MTFCFVMSVVMIRLKAEAERIGEGLSSEAEREWTGEESAD